MIRKFTFCALIASAALTVQVAGERSARAADLFYNYYVQDACGAPAQLYVSPRPTPQLVGHTYITYQPFYPHEYLYPHHRVYRGYDGRFLPSNRTTVSWMGTPRVAQRFATVIDEFRLW